MLHYIKEIKNVNPFKVLCKFNNGEVRQIDLYNKIRHLSIISPKVFGKLLDKTYFKKVSLDSYGTLSWGNEIDFCPDDLYKLSKVV